MIRFQAGDRVTLKRNIFGYRPDWVVQGVTADGQQARVSWGGARMYDYEQIRFLRFRGSCRGEASDPTTYCDGGQGE